MATRWLRQVGSPGQPARNGRAPWPVQGSARPRGDGDNQGTVMNALKIAAGACAPLLLAACAAGSAASHQGAAGQAGQGPALSAPPPGQLGTVTGVFHRV